MKVPPMELSFQGMEVLWYESSSYQAHMLGRFWLLVNVARNTRHLVDEE